MKILAEIIEFGRGSRKAQAFAFGSVALLAGPSVGLEQWQSIWFSGLCSVFIIGRAIHDCALGNEA
jgi:hypothetical protein